MNEQNTSTRSSFNCHKIAAAAVNAGGDRVIPEHVLEDYQITSVFEPRGLHLTRTDELKHLIGLVRECLQVLDNLD